MAFEMIFDSHVSSVDVLVKAGHALRYEITCGLVLLVLWFMGQLAGVRQKRTTKSVSSSPAACVAKQVQSHGDAPSRSAGKDAGNRGVASSAPQSIVQIGCIDEIDPVLLRNAAWLVPQVELLCRTQVQNAIMLYRAAVKAGLKLQKVPADECKQLFVAMVTSAIRIGYADEAMRLLRDLRDRGPGVDASLFVSAVKLFTSKHLFAECLTVYDFMVEDASATLSDKIVWSCLLFCAIEVRAYHRCSYFFEQLKACGEPSHKDYGNMMRFASLHGDWLLSLNLIKEMRDAKVEIDSVIYNTSLATCVAADQVDQARKLLSEMESSDGVADVITYNTLMKGYAKAGRMDQCDELMKDLKMRNISASQVTYGILLDGFINENQLERAAQVFNSMIAEGCTMNTVLYTTLIKGFARSLEVDQAMNVYQKMREEGSIAPDLITFSILIKANCDIDRLEEALKLLEAMIELNLRPDEVVFNNLLSGCARQANAELGKRLYSDMLASGIRPSNATFSILIRLYHQCKLLDEAVEMLRDEPAKHKVDPEPRLFLQLIQSCIRERQGRRAVEVYEMLSQHSPPTASAHSSIMTTCVKLNMFDTAAEVLGIAAERSARVDAKDANSLLESALRKRKNQVAQDVAAAMSKLKLVVDPKIIPPVAAGHAKVKA